MVPTIRLKVEPYGACTSATGVSNPAHLLPDGLRTPTIKQEDRNATPLLFDNSGDVRPGRNAQSAHRSVDGGQPANSRDLSQPGRALRCAFVDESVIRGKYSSCSQHAHSTGRYFGISLMPMTGNLMIGQIVQAFQSDTSLFIVVFDGVTTDLIHSASLAPRSFGCVTACTQPTFVCSRTPVHPLKLACVSTERAAMYGLWCEPCRIRPSEQWRGRLVLNGLLWIGVCEG